MEEQEFSQSVPESVVYEWPKFSNIFYYAKFDIKSETFLG